MSIKLKIVLSHAFLLATHLLHLSEVHKVKLYKLMPVSDVAAEFHHSLKEHKRSHWRGGEHGSLGFRDW